MTDSEHVQAILDATTALNAVQDAARLAGLTVVIRTSRYEGVNRSSLTNQMFLLPPHVMRKLV